MSTNIGVVSARNADDLRSTALPAGTYLPPGTESSNPPSSSGESTANPVGLAQVEWPVRRRRSPWQAQRCGWRILAAFRAWPNPWHNKTVGPLPQTGVIGFKSTGSATRHTSTQDRPASDVSLSPTVPRFTSETDPLAEREGFEHLGPGKEPPSSGRSLFPQSLAGAKFQKIVPT